MKGKNIGVQRLILDKNPLAFFVPCCDHSLNLVVNDAAGASGEIFGFFKLVQTIFNFFSGSTLRWDVLKKHLIRTDLTPKPLSSTRWSARIEAVKALKKSLPRILSALEELAKSTTDNETKFGAQSILNQIDFKFICSLIIWHSVLGKINAVSKILQSTQANIESAVALLDDAALFLVEFKENGFESSIEEAIQLCEEGELDIATEFISYRRGRRCAEDEELSPGDFFKKFFFEYMVDVTVNSISERFVALQEYEDLFSFLFNVSKFEELSRNKTLLPSCKKLEKALTFNDISDIDADDLCNELKTLGNITKNKKINQALDILNAIATMKLNDAFPNAIIAYRILLTLPVTVASGERSFSKLKILKNYLRSSMHQERLNGLAIISIEKDIANSLSYEDIVDEFAAAKARRCEFN